VRTQEVELQSCEDYTEAVEVKLIYTATVSSPRFRALCYLMHILTILKKGIYTLLW